jgi:transposase
LSKRIYRTYTREFKREAVRLADESDLPATQIARQLGIHRNMLASWRKQLAQEGHQAFSGSPIESREEKELERLRQEVKMLRMERDVLKKALEIISREQG